MNFWNPFVAASPRSGTNSRQQMGWLLVGMHPGEPPTFRWLAKGFSKWEGTTEGKPWKSHCNSIKRGHQHVKTFNNGIWISSIFKQHPWGPKWTFMRSPYERNTLKLQPNPSGCMSLQVDARLFMQCRHLSLGALYQWWFEECLR